MTCPQLRCEYIVDTAEDLRGINPGYGGCDPAGCPVARTLGSLVRGDGDGANWLWDATSSDDDDTVNVLLPTGRTEPGRWVRNSIG